MAQLDFRNRPFRRLELVIDASGAFSSATEGNFSLRNADSPTGEGAIASGTLSQLNVILERLGYDVSFVFTAGAAAP
jgi:hypothetical protein